MSHRRRTRRGFTLIELLVVIAVIAILAAILFPVFARAREKARQAACVANIRQIALSFRMYSEDYAEKFPPDFTGGREIRRLKEAEGMWFMQLQPYIRNFGVLHCPSDNISDALRVAGCAPKLRSEPSLPALSYGANVYLILSWLKEFQRFQTAASIPRPSQTLLFGDAMEPYAFHFYPQTDTRGVRWSHVAYANGPAECKTGYHGGHSGAGHERHLAGSILAYVDGHVQYMPSDRFFCDFKQRDRGVVFWERPIIWPEALDPAEAPSP